MKGRNQREYMPWIVLVLFPLSLLGQDIPVLQDPILEDMTDEQVVAISEEWEELQFDLPSSFNLNDEEHLRLMNSNGILSKVQWEALQAYTKTYGPLLHLYELIGIEGFSFEWLLEGTHGLFCSPMPKSGNAPVKLKAEQEMRIRNDGESSESRMLSRFRLDIDRHLSAQMVLEKDRGESVFRKAGGNGLEHFSGNLSWKGKGYFQQVVIGDFRIEGGFGLCFGKAYNAFDNRFPGGDAYLPVRITPKATSMEGYASTGVALSCLFKRLRVLAATSQNNMDGKLVFESGDWRVSGSGYGDHSTVSSNVKRDQLQLSRHMFMAGWEGRWYRTGLSLSIAELIDPLVLIDDSVSTLQRSVSKMLGFHFQGVAPDLTLELEGCSDLKSTGLKLGLSILQSNWLSFRTLFDYQKGGWTLPSTHCGMGQWNKSEKMSHYLGISAQWGRGWSAALGQRYLQDLSLAYGMPESDWDLRYWGKILHTARTGSIMLTGSFRLGGKNEYLDTPAEMIIRRAVRLQYTHNLNADTRIKLGAQFSNAGDGMHQRYWGLSFQTGIEGSLRRKNFPDYFVDFLIHDVDNADTRITAFIRDPSGGVRMLGLYHRGLRMNAGLDYKNLGLWRLWVGFLAERTLQNTAQGSFKIEALIKFQLAKDFPKKLE